MLLNKAELLEKYYTRGNPIDDADVDLTFDDFKYLKSIN